MRIARKISFGIVVLAIISGSVVGCKNDGPVERAGQKVDNAIQDVKDTVSPPGPAEKAGRQLDKTVGDKR